MLFKIANPSPYEISNERVTLIPYVHIKGDVQLLSRFIGSDYAPCHYFWDAWDGMPCGALVGVFDLAHGLEITNGYENLIFVFFGVLMEMMNGVSKYQTG